MEVTHNKQTPATNKHPQHTNKQTNKQTPATNKEPQQTNKQIASLATFRDAFRDATSSHPLFFGIKKPV